MSEIKKKRKLLGITQKELADLAEVSQSLVTKIEKGTINPSYSLVVKIFSALEFLERSHENKAKDIMTSPFTSILPEELLLKATKKMEKNAYSQLPIIDKNGICIGSISEQTILKIVSSSIHDKDEFDQIAQKEVQEVMSEPFPVITHLTPLKVISSILEFAPAVLVNENGKIKGIITRADLFKVLKK